MQLLGFLQQLPVHPRNLIVLAVDVVVAILRARKLVTVRNHRSALGKQQRGQEITALLCTQLQHLWIIRGALHTTVPGAVVAFTITVVLTIGRVVLFVVADQVIEREAVVCSDEINGVRWTTPIVLVKVRRPSQT